MKIYTLKNDKEDPARTVGLSGILTKNKALEINLYYYRKYWDWFYFTVNLGRKRDHAGFRFEIAIPFLSFEFHIYDRRHWNFSKDRWYLPGEDSWSTDE